MAGCFVYAGKAVFSIGPLPLRGPLPLAGGGKMPITPYILTDNPRHLMIRSYNTVLLKAITGVLRTLSRCAPNLDGSLPL